MEKHVLLEKPICLNMEDGKKLLELEQSTDLYFAGTYLYVMTHLTIMLIEYYKMKICMVEFYPSE